MNSGVTSGRDELKKIFAATEVRNFRLYIVGLTASLLGTWMYIVALGWVTLQVTGSGAIAGTILALQYAPLLVFGLWGGVLADRYDRRKLLIIARTLLSLSVVAMFVLLHIEQLSVPLLYALSLATGIIRIVEEPTAQSLLPELVPYELIQNAVSLRSVAGSTTRVLGTGLAGVIVAYWGAALCVALVALLYITHAVALYCIRPREFFEKEKHFSGQSFRHLVESLSYVSANLVLRNTLLLASLLGVFGYTFQLTLPLIVDRTFGEGSEMFSLLFASLGVGALLGAFRAAVAETPTEKRLGTHVLTMGVLLFAMGCIPHIYVGVPVIMLVGFFGVSATTTANSLLQLTSESGRRGIVMSLWGMGFIGVGSFGYPLMGMIGEWFGGRAPFLVSGCVLILVVLFWHRRLASSSRHKMQD